MPSSVDAPFDLRPGRIESRETLPGRRQVAARRKAVEQRFPQIGRVDEHRIAAIAGADQIGPIAVAFRGGGEDGAVLLGVEVGVGAGDTSARALRQLAKACQGDQEKRLFSPPPQIQCENLARISISA